MKLTATLLLLPLTAFLCCGSASAKPWWLRGVDSNESDFLPPDVAFRVGARREGANIKVRWNIAEGYYLYRSKIEVAPESPDLLITAVEVTRGVTKTDPYLGTQEVLLQQAEATVAFKQLDYGAHPLQIKVTYQGCAQAGLCYPPISKVLSPRGAPAPSAAPSHQRLDIAILGGLGAFLLAGLLLRRGRRLELPAL
jgi:thiol:disulfide interchange protein